MLVDLSTYVVKVQDLKKMIRCLFFIFLLINATIAQKAGDPKAGAKSGDPYAEDAEADNGKPVDVEGGDAEAGDGKSGGVAYVDPSKKWLTLNGAAPVVIARGGFSGLFPESSGYANQMAISTSLSGVIVFCNLQLSNDGVGICQTDIRLDNSTTIALIYPEGGKTYKVNGQDVKGWFALDYSADQLLNNVSLTQNVFSRPNAFDGMLPISTVDDVIGIKPPQFWLNVQYDAFYTEHKLSMEEYILKGLKFAGINYISSPEINFLKSIGGKVNKARTKLVFVFLEPDAVEPTTKQTYGAILKNLTAIKSFASGILVPKTYIWPLNNATGYLEPATTLVSDAHKERLEVYASGFANDAPLSYNYSSDPSNEYLKYIDNSQFSVDGFLTDFPPTASEAIACFAQNNVTKPIKGKPLIITHNGASGVYPGCTDLAYQQAVEDGADIIDCTVQMSKDGVAFCLDSPDLIGKSTVLTSFLTRSVSVPEIQPDNGIFSFDLTWSEIQSLKPEMENPFASKAVGLQRNPAAKNKGKFMSLDAFLELAKAKAVSGVLINIENAAYLASKKGLGVVDAVTKALSNATFDKQSTQQVLIQSDDSSVLSKFTDVPAYKRVLHLKKDVGSVPKEAAEETKKYASAVMIPRPSLITVQNGFTEAFTNVLKEMHTANISVYVSYLRNEYVSFAFDYISDPIWEIATYVGGMGVDGLQTEFPATASKYMRSPCSDLKAKLSYTILPIQPGDLIGLVPEQVQPPALAPAPPLDVADIIDPPLPPVSNVSTPDGPGSDPSAGTPNATAPAPSSSGRNNVSNLVLSLVTVMVFCWLSLGY